MILSPDDQLFAIFEFKAPWFAGFVNFLVCGIMPPELSYQQRKKFPSYVKYYFWDDHFLYKHYFDGIIRICAPKPEMINILYHCHSSSYDGHASFSKIAAKVLQSGFYWPSLFKDARSYVLAYDQCQRTGNISKRH